MEIIVIHLKQSKLSQLSFVHAVYILHSVFNQVPGPGID